MQVINKKEKLFGNSTYIIYKGDGFKFKVYDDGSGEAKVFIPKRRNLEPIYWVEHSLLKHWMQDLKSLVELKEKELTILKNCLEEMKDIKI